MKVVALVSGGKDSCYAMQRCIDYGHEIVTLANLLPLDDAVDELDSFMYQTVGHQMVRSIGQCMGLPLFRRRIQGSARVQDLRYMKTKGDEVEDLEMLLQAVKKQYPGIGGVSSGAIASDYQRLRVENVCSRLGLVSLAYLWQQDQALLLQQMARLAAVKFLNALLLAVKINSGIHAVLVKVAAMGLDPRKHLGQDLATLQPHFTRLESMYGSNICGEGGEYESLTLDSPLYKHARIYLDEFEVKLHSLDSIAPVGVLHPTKFHLKEKIPAISGSLDFGSIVIEVTDDVTTPEEAPMSGHISATTVLAKDRTPAMRVDLCLSTIAQQHGIFTFGCWQEPDSQDLDVGFELSMILSRVEAELHQRQLGWGNVVYVRLFLEDMADFGQANDVYVQHITEQKCEKGVPSRCCMQVYLSESKMGRVMLEVMAASDLSKKVLHVQSISCWAPSCIGPYSQATLHGRMLHMAGQLGLDPPTMVLVSGGAVAEMDQALRNSEAVAQAFSASLLTSAITFTLYCSEATSPKGRQQVDNRLKIFLSKGEEQSQDSGGNWHAKSSIHIPPLILYVLVPALPKGAHVEVEPSAFVASSSESYNSWEEDDGPEKCGKKLSSLWKAVQTPVTPNHLEGREEEHLETEQQQGRRTLKSNALVCSPCDSLMVLSHYLRALVCIGNDGSERTQSVEQMRPDINNLKMTLQLCMEGLCQVLEQANLCWSHVVALRVYYVARAFAGTDLRREIEDVIANQSQKVLGGQQLSQEPEAPWPQPSLIPVGAVGRTAAMQEFIAVDLTAMGAKYL